MSSTGAGYDYSCGTISPDGRIFQVEYAQKAVELGGTAIGIKCSDGIVLAVEKPQSSKLLVHGSNRRIFTVDKHVGIACTGTPADGRQLVNRAREESSNYEDTYGSKIVPSVLSNRLALFTHYFTIHGSLRPFGTAGLIASYDEDMDTPELYMGAQAARTELEKLLNNRAEGGIACADAVNEVARILHVIRDPSKDRPFELEMGWLTAANNWKYQMCPMDMVRDADARGKASLEGSASEGAAAMDTV
eukprot:GSChrysophyteH2.ASY1.ANO1.789.1 assembled CDS